jgi:hypothetical protein
MVSFLKWPLYPWGSSPQSPLNRGLDGPQKWSGTLEKKEISYPQQESTPLSPLSSLQPINCAGQVETCFLISDIRCGKQLLKLDLMKDWEPKPAICGSQSFSTASAILETLQLLYAKDLESESIGLYFK